MGYRNFTQLSKKSWLIAVTIIDVVISLIFFIIASNKSEIKAMFILFGISFILFAVCNVILFVKCLMFGDKTIYQFSPLETLDEEKQKRFRIVNYIFIPVQIVAIIPLVIAVIMLIKL